MATYSVTVTLTISTDNRNRTIFPEYSDEELMNDTISHLVKRADEFLGHGGDVTDSGGSVRRHDKEVVK